MNNYDDIINLERPISKKHGKMSIADRAAQFAPFAALTGFGAIIKETARLTDKKIELEEGEKEILDEKIKILKSKINENPIITITFFEKDLLKEGGKYIKLTGSLKKIDEYTQEIIMLDNSKINIQDISEIEINKNYCYNSRFIINYPCLKFIYLFLCVNPFFLTKM